MAVPLTMSGMTSPFATSILITGGAGFLGRGILRYIERERIDASVTVYSRDEHKHHALRERYPKVRTVLGDVRDSDRLRMVMTGHEVVIHAAAMKHIPEAERDANEAIAVNVVGSQSVFASAGEALVKKVVAISTDKATSPRNTYGATKMLMERAMQEHARLSTTTQYSAVRYGNVVSSTGSVVPLFRKQIRAGQFVTVTSEKMTRFWMAIDDAVRLVERALSEVRPHGSTFVAECPAMRVTDVVEAAARLEGISAAPPVKIIGVRPGEKLHEVLLDTHEAPYSTRDGHYFILPPALALTGDRINEVMPYESSAPTSWMDVDTMIDLMKDADSV